MALHLPASYGLGKNPWDRFILLFSALIHDVKHTGVTNEQLEVENHVIYQKHKKRDSYQERYSFDCALEMLEEDFSELYEEIAFGCPNLRSTVRKVVLSTNMESVHSIRNMSEKFEQVIEKPCVDARVLRDQSEASLGIILAMAEVGHYSQGFDLFLGWNQRQFQEHLQGYRRGRADDPRDSWYYDQVMFFHDAVLAYLSSLKWEKSYQKLPILRPKQNETSNPGGRAEENGLLRACYQVRKWILETVWKSS
jgi:hypothetical protein